MHVSGYLAERERGIEKGGSAFVVQCFVMFTPEVVAGGGTSFVERAACFSAAFTPFAVSQTFMQTVLSQNNK